MLAFSDVLRDMGKNVKQSLSGVVKTFGKMVQGIRLAMENERLNDAWEILLTGLKVSMIKFLSALPGLILNTIATLLKSLAQSIVNGIKFIFTSIADQEFSGTSKLEKRLDALIKKQETLNRQSRYAQDAADAREETLSKTEKRQKRIKQLSEDFNKGLIKQADFDTLTAKVNRDFQDEATELEKSAQELRESTKTAKEVYQEQLICLLYTSDAADE